MNKTLLVIENDDALVDLVSFYFSEHGYTVYTALDGDEGVKLAFEHKPAAIICDVIMGKVHGFDVLSTLRASPDMKETVIVITSAKAYKPDIERARELGATEYVIKPFRTDELLELVERHLKSSPRKEP